MSTALKVKRFVQGKGEIIVAGFELEPIFGSQPALTRDWEDTGLSLTGYHESGAILTREVRRPEFFGGPSIPVTQYMIKFHSGRRVMAKRV